MSHSSISELEKETGFEKEVGQTHLTQGQEDLIEAWEPSFVVHDDEKHPAQVEQGGDGESLARVQSEKPSVNNIKSVPNGGLRAWTQVVVSFFVFFNTWGIINAVSLSKDIACNSAFGNISS